MQLDEQYRKRGGIANGAASAGRKTQRISTSSERRAAGVLVSVPAKNVRNADNELRFVVTFQNLLKQKSSSLKEREREREKTLSFGMSE